MPRLADVHAAVAAKFEYRADGRVGIWRVMSGDVLRGDCEDYALTVMHRYYGGWLGMLRAIWRGEAKLWTGDSANGNKHAMGEIGGQWFDNWTAERQQPPMTRDAFIAATGHAPRKVYPPLLVTLRMLGWGFYALPLIPLGGLLFLM